MFLLYSISLKEILSLQPTYIHIMKKQIIILASLLMTFSFSCKDENKVTANEKSQMEEVMAIHDEVMPKMGTIGKLIGQIEDKIKETDAPESLMQAREDLRNSNKAMMDWMMSFGDRFDSEEIMKGKTLSEEKQKFLDEEEAKIKELRDQMNTSIKNAEELLK